MNKEKSSNNKPCFLYILLGIILIVFGFSAYKVLDYLIAQKQSEENVSFLSDIAITKIEEIPEDNVEEIETSFPEEVKNTPPPCPISVDFEALKKQNKDIIAWIYSPDTVINYPIVQGGDNQYYVKRLTNRKWNVAGSLFLDFRNSSDFSDKNSVIYGHNMTNNTMFGTIMDYSSQDYYDKHPYMYIITPEKNYCLELLTGFITKSHSRVYEFPQSDEEKEKDVSTWLEKSDFSPKFEYENDSRLVTLSTCAEAYGSKRYVLIGALKEMK